MKYLVVLPAFNEAHTIGSVIREIRTSAPFADIVVINDGSTDGTAGIASAGGAMVVNLPFNLGYGAALQTGFRFGVRGEYDLIIMMDADGQHNPASVGSLIEAMRERGADVVIGSRFLRGSYRMSVARKIGSRIFSHIARAYTGIRITDPTSGFQLLNRKAFAYLAEGDNYPLDYPDVNIIMALHKRDFRIAEAPVVMTENSTGKSMHAGLRPLYYVVKMFLAIVMVLMKRRGR